MSKTKRLQYIGDYETKVVTFNGIKVEVKKDEIFECSERNARSNIRMYPRLFMASIKEEKKLRKGWDKVNTKVTKSTRDVTKKTNKTNKTNKTTKPLAK